MQIGVISNLVTVNESEKSRHEGREINIGLATVLFYMHIEYLFSFRILISITNAKLISFYSSAIICFIYNHSFI